MWTSLLNNHPVQARLVSQQDLQALLQEPGDDVAKAYVPSRPLTDMWRGNPRRNLILGALSDASYNVVAEQLDVVSLSAGQVIHESGDVLQHVYFPTTCTASLLSCTADGETAELALTGRQGLIGVPLVLGCNAMGHSVQVQSTGQAYRMPAERFVRLLRECDELQQLALSYVQSLIAQMAQSIVCSRHHSVSERVSLWMLWNSDGLDSDVLSVTHETIAHMLGVRRESVTQAAGKLQAAGWIRTTRGKVLIQNRAGLLQSVCECYGRIQSDAQQHLHRLEQLSAGPALRRTHYVMAEDLAAPPVDLQKYVDAYDFAPVGFVTLDAQGLVMQTNLAGAIMLDIQRSQCQHMSFVGFLDEKSRPDFLAFHQEVLRGQCRRFCLVSLPATAHRAAMTLRIDATSDESGEENRMVLIDVGNGAQPEVSSDTTNVLAWQYKTSPMAAAGCLKA